LGAELADDSRWFVSSIQLDVEDVAMSRLYVTAPQSPLRSPKFYLALTAAAAVRGTSFALGKTIQSRMRRMAHSAHDVMENLSYVMLITAAGGTLIYGLYADDIPARRESLTGLEAAGLAVGFNDLVERATGRRRPFQNPQLDRVLRRRKIRGAAQPRVALLGGVAETGATRAGVLRRLRDGVGAAILSGAAVLA
jgi:hypothetical protein